MKKKSILTVVCVCVVGLFIPVPVVKAEENTSFENSTYEYKDSNTNIYVGTSLYVYSLMWGEDGSFLSKEDFIIKLDEEINRGNMGKEWKGYYNSIYDEYISEDQDSQESVSGSLTRFYTIEEDDSNNNGDLSCNNHKDCSCGKS